MNPRLALLRSFHGLMLSAVVTGAAAQGLRASPGLASSLAAQSDNRPRQADHIVALVNSEPVTNYEVTARLLRIEQQMTAQGQALPARAELARQVLDRIINERALLQLARENNVRIEDASVDRAEENVAAQNQSTVAELRRRVVQQGSTVELFRAELREQLTLQRVREREVDRTRVSEQDVDQYIREQQANTDASNIEMNLGHILVSVPEGANAVQIAALQARAQRAQQRAVAGEDFAALAKEYSDATGSSALGLRPADRYPPLFVQATQALREGGVSAATRSGAGFHVLKVIEKRQAGLPGVNVVQTRSRHILLRLSPQLSERAAVAQLAEVRKRILAGQADFAAVAKAQSQDASGPGGGDLGWVNPGTFVPEFEELLNSLAPGDMGEPLVSRFGVHLVQLLERRQTKLTDQEQRAMIRNIVREKKMEEAYVNFVNDVRGRAFVEMRNAPE